MLLLATSTLPEGDAWTYELKLDNYRAIAYKTSGQRQLRSRNDKDFDPKYPSLAAALATLPDDTVVDGEIVPWTTAAAVISGARRVDDPGNRMWRN